MSDNIADVMVHVDASLTEEQLRELEDEIRGDLGVVGIGHNPAKPHLLMVAFDSEEAHPSMLIEHLKARGLHAELVGF